MPNSYPIINIAAYKFITLEAGDAMRLCFLERCIGLGLKGTVILSAEGINLFLAGTRDAIDSFLTWLREDARLADIEVKESGSATQPFKRMLVKVKAEIITMKHPLIRPELGRAPVVTAQTLKRWLDAGCDDEGRAVVMLDTRNGFEVDVGTFAGAVDYRIEKFSDFPERLKTRYREFDGRTVVAFCTGGIRCEKAAVYMREVGLEHVFQLDGGILNYFEKVGGAHYTANCFVFDERAAVNANLRPSRETRFW